ncbi:MAG: nucleotide exchange factor GrpE [Candidatus Marinimicrobia bacterium]|nr:nucleotide exchange factor GrpE [Candidatus Neomarinimicrobiota bacterium]
MTKKKQSEKEVHSKKAVPENGSAQQPDETTEESTESQPSGAETTTARAENGKNAEKPESFTIDQISYQDPGELQEKHLRLRAEFENYRRRTAKEKDELLSYGAQHFIRKLLPIIDDLKRTVEHARRDGTPEDDPVLKGVALILDKLRGTLEAEGVQEIDAVGQEFDPEIHEALMSQKADGQPAGMVLEVFEAGYMYRERVLKHAKVIVSG